MAKNFENMNTAKVDTGISSGSVIDAIERTSNPKKKQGKASPEERDQRQKELKTQGRFGCKLPRINLAFSPENYEYVQAMSRASGKSMTAYINSIIDMHRETHQDIYDQVKEFQKTMIE